MFNPWTRVSYFIFILCIALFGLLMDKEGMQWETTLANMWYVKLWVCSHTILRCRHALTALQVEYHRCSDSWKPKFKQKIKSRYVFRSVMQ